MCELRPKWSIILDSWLEELTEVGIDGDTQS